MTAFLEYAASGRTKCFVCGAAIANGAPRIVDESFGWVAGHEQTKRRYVHVACAVETQNDLARAALIARESPYDLVREVMPEVERIDPRLATDVEAVRGAPIFEYEPGPALGWCVGYVKKLEVRKPALLGLLLSHPACEQLEILHVTGPIALPDLPRSLRQLLVTGDLAPRPPIGDLPLLEYLAIDRCDELAHPTLRTLVLGEATAQQLTICAAGLPAVSNLVVERLAADAVDHPWLARVANVEIMR